MPALDSDQNRYSRQIRLPEIGEEGQRRISQATVAVLGCGALGSVTAELLARAGVGHLILIDRDVVQWSNLQRQLLYTERDARLGLPKAAAAASRLRKINRSVKTTPLVIDLVPENIIHAIKEADVCVDASDNFDIRYLLNDAMIFLEKPWIHGGCVGTSGQVLTIWPKQTPCFLCIVPEPPPLGSVITCDRAGVLGSATATVAALQVTAALRVLVAPEASKTGQMVCVDVWNSTFKTIDTMPLRGTACPACQEGKLSFLEMTDSQQPVPLCGQNAVQLPPLGSGKAISLTTLARDLESPENPVQLTAFFLRIQHGIYRITIFKDGRGVVEGTEDPAIARTIWHQVLGV